MKSTHFFNAGEREKAINHVKQQGIEKLASYTDDYLIKNRRKMIQTARDMGLTLGEAMRIFREVEAEAKDDIREKLLKKYKKLDDELAQADEIVDKFITHIDQVNRLAEQHSYDNVRVFYPTSKDDIHIIHILISMKESMSHKLSFNELALFSKELENLIGCKINILIEHILNNEFLQAIVNNTIPLCQEKSHKIENMLKMHQRLLPVTTHSLVQNIPNNETRLSNPVQLRK